MSNLITGQLVGINPPVTNGSYTSQKAIFIVEPGQYQTYLEVEFGSKVMPALAGLVVGQNYDVHVNIRGSKNMLPSTRNQGHMTCFNSIQAWKIEPAGQHVNINTPAPAQGGFAQPAQAPQGFGQQAPPVAQPAFGQAPPAFAQPQAQPFGQPAQQQAPAFGAPQTGGFVGSQQ